MSHHLSCAVLTKLLGHQKCLTPGDFLTRVFNVLIYLAPLPILSNIEPVFLVCTGGSWIATQRQISETLYLTCTDYVWNLCFVDFRLIVLATCIVNIFWPLDISKFIKLLSSSNNSIRYTTSTRHLTHRSISQILWQHLHCTSKAIYKRIKVLGTYYTLSLFQPGHFS